MHGRSPAVRPPGNVLEILTYAATSSVLKLTWAFMKAMPMSFAMLVV